MLETWSTCTCFFIPKYIYGGRGSLVINVTFVAKVRLERRLTYKLCAFILRAEGVYTCVYVYLHV
jgi:hypothetical protein